MDVSGAFRRGPVWRAWKLLVVLAGLYLIGAIAFATVVILRVDESQGHAGGFAAAVAVAFGAIGVIAFLVALGFAWALRRSTAKPVVAVALVAAGWFPYWASGYFEGFAPLFAGAVVVALVALYERYLEPG